MSKKPVYILMCALVFAWGFEYIVAKNALEAIVPITLVFFKYVIAGVCLSLYKLMRRSKWTLRKRDIPYYLLGALFGDIIYFVGEYGSMYYMPVALVTIVLSFVPAVSISIEAIFFRVKPTAKIIAGIVVSIAGICLVVGADMDAIRGGALTGYLLAFMAVISWNIFNFITNRLTRDNKPFDVTLFQIYSALLLSAPYALTHLPMVSAVDNGVVLSVLFLGVISAGVGFVIYVYSIDIIGVTPTSLFSNMLPVTTTFFGWLCLGESINYLQMIGGAVVVAAGAYVIYLKGKNTSPHTLAP